MERVQKTNVNQCFLLHLDREQQDGCTTTVVARINPDSQKPKLLRCVTCMRHGYRKAEHKSLRSTRVHRGVRVQMVVLRSDAEAPKVLLPDLSTVRSTYQHTEDPRYRQWS